MTMNRQVLCMSKLGLVLLMGFGTLGCEAPTDDDGGCSSFEAHACEGACILQDGICVEIQDQSLINYQTQEDCTAAGFGWDWRAGITHRCYPIKQAKKAVKQCRDRAAAQCTGNVGCVLVDNVCTEATVKPPCKQTTQDACEAQGDKCLWGADRCYNAPVGKPLVVKPAAVPMPRMQRQNSAGTTQPTAKFFKCVLKSGTDREALCNARTNMKDCNKKIDGKQQLCRYKVGKSEKCQQIDNLCQEASKASWRTSFIPVGAAAAVIGGVVAAIGGGGAAPTPATMWSSAGQQQFFCNNATVRLEVGGIINATPVVVGGGGLAIAFPVMGGGGGLDEQQPKICDWAAAGRCESRLVEDICDQYYTTNPPAAGYPEAARRDWCEQGDTGEMLLQRNPQPGVAGINASVHTTAGAPAAGLAMPPAAGGVAGGTIVDFAATLGVGSKICRYTPAVAATCEPVHTFDCNKVALDECGKGDTAKLCEKVPAVEDQT